MQYLISFTFIVYLGTKVWRIMTVKSNRKISGTSWMAIREKIFNYFDAQKVIQQISIFFKSQFHIGADCQKSYLEVFFLPMISFVTPKNFNFDTPPPPPPFVLFAHMSKFFVTNIRYFSLNIWVVYGKLELDWYVFDQNWAKTIPSHFKIFQIHNASDRPIVQCTNCLKPYDMSHQKNRQTELWILLPRNILILISSVFVWRFSFLSLTKYWLWEATWEGRFSTFANVVGSSTQRTLT